MTVHDLGLPWPETEKALATDKEIIITRDGVPVAKLSAIGDRAAEEAAQAIRSRGASEMAGGSVWQRSGGGLG
jgi:hypothetical protein